MRKSSIYTAIGVMGATIGIVAVQSYFKDNNRNGEEKYSTFENAGIPDQLSRINDTQLENSKMVSEGSQFGVHYYNKYKED